MEKEFVPYVEALALKELEFPQGFTDDGIWYYVTLSSGKIKSFCWTSSEDEPPKMFNPIVRPTFSQAFRWFREKYDMCPSIEKITEGDVYKFKYNVWAYTSQTYEEAELACLIKLIEIVKEKK